MTTAPDRMVERALFWGLEGIELRTVGGPDERVPYVNEARLHGRLDHSELVVCSVVPGLFEAPVSDRAAWLNDLALLDETLAFCDRFGCGLVVVSSFASGSAPATAADVLRRAGDRAAASGCGIAVVNEQGHSCTTASELLELVGVTDHPAVGAAWDPAVGPVQAADAAGSIRGMADAAVLVRYPVDAALDWPRLLGALGSAGYRGPVSLVLPGSAGPTDGLRAATGLVDLLRVVAAQNSNPA